MAPPWRRDAPASNACSASPDAQQASLHVGRYAGRVSEPVDLDLRVVRYFAAVAGHEHFGRAAAALHITQPSLSRQIRGLEKQLGTTLFDRTPQGSRLTEAGRAFLPHAEELLTAAARAAAHARAAAAPRRLVVGYTTNLAVGEAVREMRVRHPEAEISTRHLPWNGAHPALLAHDVDVAVTRLPMATDGVEVMALYSEPRALLVSRRHRLAGRDHAGLADVAAEPMPRIGDRAWDAFWRIDPRPDGRPAPDGPLIEELAELVDYLADGAGVLIAPADSRLPDLHPGLVTVPLRDVEPARVALARRAGAPSALIDAFADCARRHMTAGQPSPRR
jgi:DNA-binding transcriptional LysR family regulator